MIDKNIKNQITKEELLEMINMEKRKTALEYIIQQETQKLQKNNTELKEKYDEIKVDKQKLVKENEILTNILNYYSNKGDIPKEIQSILLKI